MQILAALVPADALGQPSDVQSPRAAPQARP